MNAPVASPINAKPGSSFTTSTSTSAQSSPTQSNVMTMPAPAPAPPPRTSAAAAPRGSSSADSFLKDANLIAEAAKRAQVAVMVRDFEDIGL